MAMDVKKKLVELIKDGIRKGLRAKGDDRLDYSFEDVADYLIAHGVTVQSERMVDAVPVSELEKLRDYLYAEDLIFMRGLAKLNKLIAKHGGTEAGKTPDKNTKP